jgi:hypothetical protein
MERNNEIDIDMSSFRPLILFKFEEFFILHIYFTKKKKLKSELWKNCDAFENLIEWYYYCLIINEESRTKKES